MAMEVSIMLFISTPPPPRGGDGRFWNGLVQQKTRKSNERGRGEVNRPQSQAQ